MKDFFEDLVKPIVTVLVLVLLVCGVVVVVVVNVEFVYEVAAIEQLRSDVMAGNSCHISGQAAEYNQQIVGYRAMNNMVILCLFIPNGWDNVALIELGE